MNKSKFGRRVIAFVLVLVMVASLLPLSTLAASKGDIVTDRSVAYTGIENDTLNKNGTINWPVKIYDYLADGMLFEYAQANGTTMYSYNETDTDDNTGQYVLGKPMPPTIDLGHDYTTDRAHDTLKVTTSNYESSGSRYTKTKVAAVDYESPQYLRITTKSGYLTNKDPNNNNLNCRVLNFYDDCGGATAKANVQYLAIVYRANGLNDANGFPALAITLIDGNGTKWRFPAQGASNTIHDTKGNEIPDSSEWRVFVCDFNNMRSSTWKNDISKVRGICFRIPQDKSTDYFDIAYIAGFSTEAKAKAYGEKCLEFLKEPGEYRSGNYWNGAGNDSFGMLYATNGGPWANSGGGSPDTSTNGGKYAGYWAQAVGGFPTKYESKWATAGYIANNRLDGVDSNGRYNGTGSKIGDKHQIYLIRPTSFAGSGKEYDMSELEYDGYNLLTKATKGIFTTGLLEGQLGADGTPQYREETVRYIADMLSKTLVISRMGDNSRHNYNFVAGVKNGEQYGYTEVSGKQVPNDLAQALRNCLGITFSGNKNASAPKMGTYAETLAKADKLKGAFLVIEPNIETCMDAAYYLLNNLFIDNSYNQLQNDYKYLTLSSAKLTTGEDVYVFDGGYSNGASLDDLKSGDISQSTYEKNSNSAVEYSSLEEGGDGTISLNKVDEKDYFYYTSSSTTTLYPFLPVTDAEGVYAGGTDSYYFAEDGKRSYTDKFDTYKNRNYNYVLASNGEFVFHEEENLFFEFEGDDDVYLFINGQLVLDLGGGHSISACKFNLNSYVDWARKVLADPDSYSEEMVARAEKLNLKNGEIVSFDFYYMERHGYGANMRIVTNMRITDPALRVEKSAYQSGEKVEYGGIVDADKPIEYNFTLSNVGNTKLYNLSFDDKDIGVSLTPDRGLVVQGDDTASEDDDINGYYVTDARGGRLDPTDLTAVVTGYKDVGSGGNYIKSGHTYTKVTDGAGTHIYLGEITVKFKDNEELMRFLHTLESELTDGSTVDDEVTQQGAGLWVDSSVTIKGIYYTLEDEHEDAGMFENTVYVSASVKADPDDPANEYLLSEARHRVYITAIPYYYQWAGRDLFMSKKRILDDATAESGDTSSLLHDYQAFFNSVNGDISKFDTKFCDMVGNVVPDNYYESVSVKTAKDGTAGFVANYTEPGIKEFYLLMYKKGASGLPSDLSTLKASDLNLSDYAVVRVLVIVADVKDAEYVLDYGLSTESLDTNGDLFKNDYLYGTLSGTQALLMGITNEEPYYRNYDSVSDYNRIDFSPVDISHDNRIQTEDGYYKINMLIPETGKVINYDEASNMYTLTETGTVRVHVDCPASWKDVYLYYWYDDGRSNLWPGEKMSSPSHGNYEMYIPSNVPHIILSNGTNQTVDLNLNTGKDVWVDIPGTLNADNKLYATVSYKSADGVIHAQVPEDWGDVYVYCWDAFGNGLVEWPGTRITETDENGYFTCNIPGDITNVIINNGNKGKQTRDLVVFAGSETWITVNSTVVGENENKDVAYYGATSSRSTETVTMHASVPKDWANAYLYYWNSNGSATGIDWPGLPMTKGEDGQYYIDNIPADVTNVIINDGNKDNAKQTHNLTISSGIEAWFNVTVDSGEGDTKIVANVPTGWSNAYVYFFNGSGDVGSAWPGKAATKVSAGVFTIDAPEGATHYIVNNNNGEQTQNIKLILGATNEIEYYSHSNARPVSETELHIEPKLTWDQVYVHYWYNDTNGNAQGTVWPGEAAQKNDDGTFSFSIPAGYNKFIVHNNAGSQTADITEFYMGIENHVTVYEDNSYKIGMPYKTDIVYGENAEKEGIFFTPTNFMDSRYSIWMAITVYENKVDGDDEGNVTDYYATPLGESINIGREVQMFKKITVLPATVVYYEDDFAGIKYNTESTTNVLNHYGEGSGSLSQSIDQKQEYGQDSVYQGSENDEMTGNSLTDVRINGIDEIATFDFTGTGFEIIGHTHAVESGTIRVVVKDEQGNVVAEPMVITEYDNGADGGTDSIVSVPIIRVSGLAYGKYSVSVSGVPVVGRVDGSFGILPSYICIDGVRVYQPLASDSDETGTPEAGKDNSYLETENGSSFTEIRNLIADSQAFAIRYDDTDGLSVSGGTSTWIENRNNDLPSSKVIKWTGNEVKSVEDYLLAGPNNEVYMVESTDTDKSGLLFYVQEDDSAVHNMQVAIRAVDYGSFMGSKETGKTNAEIQYGAMVDGKLVWKHLTTIVTSSEQYFTIPYTECPYDAENNRYQVLLKVADTDVTGMASYTTIKLNGLNTIKLNMEDISDKVFYTDDITNTIIDSYGNTLDSSKFTDFVSVVNQMNSDVVMYSNGGQPAPEGVDTSALGALYDSFTADPDSNFVLTNNSKIYIVTDSESNKPDAETIETAQLVQSQLRTDNMPSAEPLEIVWGLEKYASSGDIVIYAKASGYGTEQYKLIVTDKAVIYAADDNALLYGLNTLQKHFRQAGTNAIKGFTIIDQPDTKERTVHLDCARKYLTAEHIKNYIAEMSWMGYNALELHMSEDGGFRMDFWGDTALSQVPGMTGNDFSWVCGSNPAPWVYTEYQDTADKGKYLTTEEVIDICQTAKEYNMEIIPSFDTPAHVGYMTELYYNTVKSNSKSPIRNFTYNGTNYTLPTQINYREYTGSSDSRYDFSVLDLSNDAVKNFAYAMYTDIAAFFKYYAGSEDFNIGADEVALKSSDVWTYTDFVNYANSVNAVLKSQGYTVRMYNDFVDNTKYSTSSDAILDADIEIVYWDAPSVTTSDSTENIRRASHFYSTQDRVVYSGVQNWTYYVLRIAPTSVATHMDARDPANRQWTFYRNQEDLSYAEWNPTLLSEYTLTNGTTKHGHYTETYSGENLGGGYFMVWNDFAGLNTEVEVWNGCYDEFGKYSSGKASGYGYYYSLIERMWSNAAKQWNWDLNSTLPFESFEALRDNMGFFPGYVPTDSSQAYSNGFELPAPTAVSDEAYRTSYTVTFKNYDGTVLSTQQVKDGFGATAPEAPTRPYDVWYTYTFTGWDKDFSDITGDTVVTAQFDQKSTISGQIGYLEVKVSGGTNFTMSVNGGAAKPMGLMYTNTAMEFGKVVTLKAESTNGNVFIGWMDAKNGEIVSTSATYTFSTSGNDVLVALFDASANGDFGLVTFRNDKTNQVIDIQYYSSEDKIIFPTAVSYPGYIFEGWEYTEAQIQEMIAQGMSVTVNPVWSINKDVTFSVEINGGVITEASDTTGDGRYYGYKSIAIEASAAPEGKMFAYWADEEGNVLSYDRQYKFFPYKDTVITAVFLDEEVVKDIILNVGMDTESIGDSNIVVFDWYLPEELNFNLVNVGLILVREEDYLESTFVKGTIDPNVIQFVPAQKYQTASGVHSVTLTDIAVNDGWIACAFMQYRDEQGVLRTKYSKQVTGKKD